MSDYRMEIVKSIEESIIGTVNQNQLQTISSIVVRILNDYEITERCTDIVKRDTANEKLIKRYCACLLIDGKSEKTIEQYRRALYHLDAELGISFVNMGTYDIRYYLACKTKSVSNRTLENTRSYISSFFQWMTNEEIISKNPLSNIKPIKYTDEVRLPFSDIEIDQLRSACKDASDRALIEILLSTGIRVSELALMDIQDIDFATNTIHIKHAKGNKERIVYMTAIAAKYLKDYIINRKYNNTAVIMSHRGKRMDCGSIRYRLKTIAKKADVENVHPHRFRRTFATNLAKKGMDIQDIQKLLGHSNISTTMVYITLDDEKIKASYIKYVV